MSLRFPDTLEGRPWVRRTANVVALALAFIAGVVAFSATAHGELSVGPARLTLSLSPSTAPLTVVELPPFGSVEAPTHRGPIQLTVRLQEIDVVESARIIGSSGLPIAGATGSDAMSELPVSGVTGLLWRLLGGGLLAAAAAAALVTLALRRTPAVVALGVLLAVALPGAAVGAAYSTWDVSAFREPTLRGSLTYAPQLVDIFSTRVADIERLREQAANLATSLAAYYADERSLASGGALPGTYRVLHVSDLHMDAVGAELARSIARSYETSLVIDTGDMPILGAPVEVGVLASLVDTSVPRVYVPGNHDSPASIEALESLGVTVVSSGTVEVDGLRILGVRDPISRGFGIEPDPALVGDAARGAFAQLRMSIRLGEELPDIVAVHNPLMEQVFVGTVPVIVSGHTHSGRFYVSEGTVRLNSGTLGGMPYDPDATGRSPVPYSASVLYFTAEEPRHLIAVDRIAVYPQRRTTVTREVVDESLLP